jgi:transposase-like protein
MASLSGEFRSERAAYWQGLIEEHSRSGLSVPEFCKQREISSTSFYQWRAKLRRRSEPVATSLVPVKLVSTSARSQPVARCCIQVVTPSGVSLTLSGGASEEDLVKVLRAIEMLEASRSC